MVAITGWMQLSQSNNLIILQVGLTKEEEVILATTKAFIKLAR